jgi:hypothetical protein
LFPTSEAADSLAHRTGASGRRDLESAASAAGDERDFMGLSCEKRRAAAGSRTKPKYVLQVGRAMRGLLLVSLLVMASAGCLANDGRDGPSDEGSEDPEGSGANATLPARITGLEPVARPDEETAFGEWVEDGVAYLSGPSGLRIYGVRDPMHPVALAVDVADTQSRDVDLLHHPNGRLYAVLADSGESYMKLVDVTDPTAPVLVGHTSTCVHTVAVVPDSTIVYGSWSLCHASSPTQAEQGDVEIVDFADPLSPVSKIMPFPPVAITVDGTPRPITATSCHEMSFNAALHRAYCAAISDTQVWDTTDAWNPVILQVIDDPLVNIHHSVWDARNGTLLIIGDEFVGVLAPTPTCSDSADLPTSALAFYDITDLASPVRVGYYQVDYDAIGASAEAGKPIYCSTHLGDVIDGEDLIVMGWYSAGTVLIGFSDPAAPTTVAYWRADGDSSVWEARYMDGYVYSADEVRGLDILAIVGDG